MKALIPGSFDPITIGHMDLIRRTAAVFDEVWVVEMKNSAKQYLFSEQERLLCLRTALSGFSNVKVDAYDGLLADYASIHSIHIVVKGVRNFTDFEYETQMALCNQALFPALQTLFLPAAPHLQFISSTFVRTLLQDGKDVSAYLPSEITSLPFFQKFQRA